MISAGTPEEQSNKSLGSHPGRARGRIAVLTAEVNEAYQAELWRGITAEARRHSKQLVCFVGSRVDSPIQQEAASNAIYRQAHSGNFDGIIIISSAVSTYLDPQQVQFLFDAHPRLPRVSVGIPVEGVSSVCVDGRSAMAEVTRHLIYDHHRRNFAVIAGPQWHPESEERRHTIQDTLGRAGLNLKDDLVIHGNFQHKSGRDAMAALLDQGHPIDALLCLNDRMAMGAVEELTRRGITVPQDISVCGFDGIEESEFCSPPLTTVIQPLYDLGVQAVQELYLLMEGGTARHTTLDCRPLIRQSCSCSALSQLRLRTANPRTVPEPEKSPGDSPTAEPPDSSDPSDPPDPPDSPDLSNPSDPHDPSEPHDPADPAPGKSQPAPAPIRDNVPSGLAGTGESPLDQEPQAFIDTLDELVTRASFESTDIRRWNAVLDRIEAGLTGTDHAEPWLRVILRGREILAESRTRRLVETRIQKRNRLDVLRSVGTSLSEAFEMPEIFRRLTEGLVRLGFQDAFLVLYRPGTRTGDLIFHMESGIQKPVSPRRVEPLEILPASMADLQRRNMPIWILTPLVFQDRAIGHLLLPGDHPDTEVYDTLTKQIASSIQGATLLERIKSHEQSLEQEVQHRTRELTQVNADLRQEIATRVRLEQEVIDISKHTMERIGQDLHDDLCQHLAGITMHVSALGRRIGPVSPESLVVLEQINSLLGDSIQRAKSLVRGLLPPGLREEGLSRAVEHLCREISRASGVQVDFHAPSSLTELDVDRGIELYRIIQEALNNAVKHSGSPRILVSLSPPDPETGNGDRDGVKAGDGESQKILLTVDIRDWGRGFPDQNHDQGMGLKIMRYRGEKADIQVDLEHPGQGSLVRCRVLDRRAGGPASGTGNARTGSRRSPDRVPGQGNHQNTHPPQE
ncbi:substrate-binding domain-containing protein [Spirochaeta lutea]|uniref:Histidine kinase/HSP90-like ATPase domain-containing protein n=1 Tax=Spirochaeta lutea TaxID=1480694 RepID=A0A098QWV7_9SPIO|nr:substrate-binding domain-containing protein [Spirochaeta lutea]KGE70982.1 hypothetical protein DC28_13705 [Spirochaeta lutea]